MVFVAVTLTPILTLFAVFSLLPIGLTAWLSLRRYNGLTPDAPFVGEGNFTYAFGTDPFFLDALFNTLKFVAVAVPLNILLALPIALGLSRINRLRALFRSMFFLPVTASAAAVALIWLPVYDPQSGWLNLFLTEIGLGTEAWLQNPGTALWAVLVVAVWQDLGFSILIFLAGLQGIPDEFQEAAKVDGAPPWARFFFVTLPLLKRTFVFILVLTMITSMQQFTHVEVMTEPPGGPVHSTETLVFYIWTKGFRDFQMGYASAMAMVLMGIILLITLVQLRTMRTRWEY
jgi:ABC-type sugar transport system permease subunit